MMVNGSGEGTQGNSSRYCQCSPNRKVCYEVGYWRKNMTSSICDSEPSVLI